MSSPYVSLILPLKSVMLLRQFTKTACETYGATDKDAGRVFSAECAELTATLDDAIKRLGDVITEPPGGRDGAQTK